MKILLVGYYGFGNVGDDICLEKTQVILNQKFFSPVIWILANQDNDHLNMIDRWNFFLVIKTIFCVDAIVFGGGGLLQNKTSNVSLFYYLCLIVLGRLFNKKIFLLAQGIGPINGKIANVLLRLCLGFVSKVTIRSKEASIYFKSATCFKVTSDLAFYEAPLFLRDDAIKTNFVGVNVCDSQYDNIYFSLIKTVQDLSFQVQGLSFCDSLDTQLLCGAGLLENDIKKFSVDQFYQLSAIHYDFVITMRYHSCIWAILQGIPFIALGYDEKVCQLATLLKQPCLMSLDFQEEHLLVQAIESLTSNFGFYRGNIVKGRELLVESSKLNEWVFYGN